MISWWSLLLLIGKDGEDRFYGTYLITDLYFDIGFKRDKKVYPGAEFYYSALVSAIFNLTGLGVAYDTACKGACNLLEEHFTMFIGHA